MSRRAIVDHDGARGRVGRAYALFGPFRVQGNAQDALELFWGDWLSEEPDEDLDRVMDSAQVNLATTVGLFSISTSEKAGHCSISSSKERVEMPKDHVSMRREKLGLCRLLSRAVTW